MSCLSQNDLKYAILEKGKVFLFYNFIGGISPMPQTHEDSLEEVKVGTKTILVVEDDDAISELITLVLSQETPYSPLVVADASEALRLATCLKVDLFLIDYQLADMNGFQLYDTLQSMERLQPVPALLLSASREACKGTSGT
jgi:PleD family two-component response regulator